MFLDALKVKYEKDICKITIVFIEEKNNFLIIQV